MIKFNEEIEIEGILNTAKLMAVSARTAPKSKGIDNIVIALITDEDIEKIRKRMKEIGERENIPFFVRDSVCLESCKAILLVGVKKNPLGLSYCSYCGFKNCREMKKNGANCFFNIVDLGIAVSSAINTASLIHVDTRVMFSIGKTAKDLGIMPEDVEQILGIPLSATGKSPYFDREIQFEW